LINSPSSISISLRRRMTNIAPMLYFCRGRGRSSKAISHVSGVPWPRPPRHSPSPPSPEIRPPSDLGRCASIISELDMACTNSLASSSFSRPSEMFPSTHIILAAAQLALYRTLELSADDADACVAQPAGASHLAALVTTLALRAYPPLRTARPLYPR
ncbi:hypothetical protein EDB89DRAFT_2048038, partial [Lactarius sanguifluus]